MALVRPMATMRMAPPAVPSRTARPKERSHKVIRETVTAEKKKLRSVITFHTQPPEGYTFIPAGNPELTQALKDAAREVGRKIFAVTTTPHQKAHELSKEVHRVGFHFPSDVVAAVCQEYGIQLTRSGTIVGEETAESFQRRRKGKHNNSEKNLDQVTINTKAKDAIQDLFPNIPERDLYMIIKTAFQKGQNKVGTANELTLVRRAQLSVVAHIRHLYTNYDRLLRTVGYHDARGKVEGPTLKKLVEWRGDDENGKKVLEEVIADVIVLDDDEDSDQEGDLLQTQNTDELSARQAVQAEPLSPQDPEFNRRMEDEREQGYRYIPQVSTRRRVADKSYVDEGQYRRDAWERARREFRENPTSLQPIILLENSPQDRYLREPPEFNFNDPISHSRPEAFPSQDIPQGRNGQSQAPYPPNRGSSTFVRGEDGYLYEKIVRAPPEVQRIAPLRTSIHPAPKHSIMQYPPSHKYFQSNIGTSHGPVGESPRLRDESNTIVQSIEGPQLSPTSLRLMDREQRPSSANAIRQTRPGPKLRDEIIDLTESSIQPSQRKRKLDKYGADESSSSRLRGSGLERAQSRVKEYGQIMPNLHHPHELRAVDRLPEHVNGRPIYEQVHITESPRPAYLPTARRTSPSYANRPASPSFLRQQVDGASDSATFVDHSFQSRIQPVRRTLPVENHFVQYPMQEVKGVQDLNIHHRREVPITLIGEHMSDQRFAGTYERPTEILREYPRETRRHGDIVELRSVDDSDLLPRRRPLAEMVSVQPAIHGHHDLVGRRTNLVQSPNSDRQPLYYEDIRPYQNEPDFRRAPQINHMSPAIPMADRRYDVNRHRSWTPNLRDVTLI